MGGVYTCSKDHQHRCKFFLWASDAEAREKLALLSNSRSESTGPGPGAASSTPQTPSSKTRTASRSTGLLTPQTGHRDEHPNPHSGSESRFGRTRPSDAQSAKARMMAEDTDEFEWDERIDSEVERIVDVNSGNGNSNSRALRQPDFGLGPRKTPRTEKITSPGKRKRDDDDDDDDGEEDGRSFTATPGSMAPPFQTPTPTRYRNAVPPASSAVGESPLASSEDLAGQVSAILEGHGVSIPVPARRELRELFGRHEMKMKGIIRGRDISRVALQKKDEQIASLKERIAGLEAQRELNRTASMGGLRGE
ncbi:hypothetical protein BJX61DRAFT_257430 [Aspergillus egyptiacus]|nr:hypothetical protein BJX61DRAFT_257430 [Aspergillus egyptiacus]